MAQQKQDETNGMEMQEVTLQNDTGGPITFKGRLCSEHSSYDEGSGELTLQRLYETDKAELAYHIVTSSDKGKERRAYLMKLEGERCQLFTGTFHLTVDVNDLSTVVRELCGLDSDLSASDLMESLEETSGKKDNAVNG